MKLGIAVFAALCLTTRVVAAAESRVDRETDHLDAFDEGGPRSLGMLINPAAAVFGFFGAELDLVLSEALAASVAGDYFTNASKMGYRGAVGALVFPQRVAFHGLYLNPRLSLQRATDGPSIVDVVGCGATMGWQWTLRLGLTFRAGAGASILHRIDAVPTQSTFGSDRFEPLVDGAIGWVF